MVHAGDGEHPASLRIGIISSADLERARVELTFGNLSQQTFELNQVHVLKSRHSLYELLLSSSSSIAIGDFKTLFKVNMLQDRGDASSLLDAFQLLKSQPSAMMSATEPLSLLLGRAHEHSAEVQKSFSR